MEVLCTVKQPPARMTARFDGLCSNWPQHPTPRQVDSSCLHPIRDVFFSETSPTDSQCPVRDGQREANCVRTLPRSWEPNVDNSQTLDTSCLIGYNTHSLDDCRMDPCVLLTLKKHERDGHCMNAMHRGRHEKGACLIVRLMPALVGLVLALRAARSRFAKPEPRTTWRAQEGTQTASQSKPACV